ALVVQVWIGLSPLKQMEREIRELQDGKRQKLTGTYPEEIAPVVREINEFITMQELSTERGRRRAGDLAHGFKTPLTILAATARQLEEQGASRSASLLRQQIALMNHHVERELARAKIGIAPHRTSESTPVKPVIEKIIATLKHVPRERPIDWRLDAPVHLAVRMERGDLTEICGNLLENAHKWARKAVTVSARTGGDDTVIIEIEDDGPGVPREQFELILQRGKRLDETVRGNGLGLAIVTDIMAAYKYRLEPYHNSRGGLGMRLNMAAGAA
ncbi:MAG TPA: sensor histidine kinase, partial [Rhodobacteraceae bacterium]|nr:sensor histidine kinase [Paracoccaceae bacterium]